MPQTTDAITEAVAATSLHEEPSLKIAKAIQRSRLPGLLVPPFNGEPLDNGARWLRLFKRTVNIEEWDDSDALRAFTISIRKDAEDYMESKFGDDFISPEKKNAKATLERMMAVFENKYASNEANEIRLNALMALQQQEGEDFSEFIQRAKAACDKAGERSRAFHVAIAGLANNLGRRLTNVFAIENFEQLTRRGPTIVEEMIAADREKANRRSDGGSRRGYNHHNRGNSYGDRNNYYDNYHDNYRNNNDNYRDYDNYHDNYHYNNNNGYDRPNYGQSGNERNQEDPYPDRQARVAIIEKPKQPTLKILYKRTSSKNDRMVTKALLNGAPVSIHIDTGSQISLISKGIIPAHYPRKPLTYNVSCVNAVPRSIVAVAMQVDNDILSDCEFIEVEAINWGVDILLGLPEQKKARFIIDTVDARILRKRYASGFTRAQTNTIIPQNSRAIIHARAPKSPSEVRAPIMVHTPNEPQSQHGALAKHTTVGPSEQGPPMALDGNQEEVLVTRGQVIGVVEQPRKKDLVPVDTEQTAEDARQNMGPNEERETSIAATNAGQPEDSSMGINDDKDEEKRGTPGKIRINVTPTQIGRQPSGEKIDAVASIRPTKGVIVLIALLALISGKDVGYERKSSQLTTMGKIFDAYDVDNHLVKDTPDARFLLTTNAAFMGGPIEKKIPENIHMAETTTGSPEANLLDSTKTVNYPGARGGESWAYPPGPDEDAGCRLHTLRKISKVRSASIDKPYLTQPSSTEGSHTVNQRACASHKHFAKQGLGQAKEAGDRDTAIFTLVLLTATTRCIISSIRWWHTYKQKYAHRDPSTNQPLNGLQVPPTTGMGAENGSLIPAPRLVVTTTPAGAPATGTPTDAGQLDGHHEEKCRPQRVTAQRSAASHEDHQHRARQ